ncbi:MAG: hypothetical protein ACK40O_12725 [Allosphingosinicella sp.]
MAKRKRPGLGPAGLCVRAGGKDGSQLVETRGHRWSEEAQEIFLDHLGATCNYSLSAKRTGFSKEAIFRRRRRDPVFARLCFEATSQGYARIEALLVETAERLLDGRGPDPDSPIPAMTVAEAIAVLKLHRPEVRGEGKAPGWRARPRSLDEMRDSILKKLSAFERSRGAS